MNESVCELIHACVCDLVNECVKVGACELLSACVKEGEREHITVLSVRLYTCMCE